MNDQTTQTNNSGWHSRWHAFPHHSQVHWLVLAVLVWATGLVFMGRLVSLKNSDKQLAQAVVLGDRTSRPAPKNNAIENEPAVKGESTGPATDDVQTNRILPSEINLQDIQPARNMNAHLRK